MLISLKPRSIFSVTVIAYALVTIPFALVALLAAAFAKQLTLDSNQLLEGGLRLIEQSRLMEDSLVAMERAARQYWVVGDPSLRELFDERHREMTGALEKLAAARPEVGGGWDVAQIRADADEVAAIMQRADHQSWELTQALGRFERMQRQARNVTDLARSSIRLEAETIRGNALRSERLLVSLSVVLLPVALFVAVLLAFYVVLPLRRMDRAITNLGAGRLDEPITVGGPEELRALSRQLDWLRDRLRTVEKDKNRFLRHMAHELKTPLASVREGSDLLAEGVLGALSVRQQEVANILRNNCFELQTLIENLITYEEWREKSGRLQRTRFALRPLIVQCVQRYRLLIASKRIRIDLRCAELEARADHQYLRMALDNLISNALKFSPAGGVVTVSAMVGAARDGEGEKSKESEELTIEVADEGPGIPYSERPKIFEAFYQGAPPPSRRHLEGSGIGLAVVRDCIGAHGGTIEIVDGHFPGAHFRVRIPMPLQIDETAVLDEALNEAVR